ncbi:MAG TPA: FAD-binding oxidoreductase [Chthonomonadaceae bacterium]|nr:FAD-binding oxidoreductase [Chthonomonadaceae bacterium]
MPDLADVVIVGGGLLGAALAAELSRRTLRVILLEAHALAGAASGNGFAWVNATAKLDREPYHHLNALGLAHYDMLAAEWGVERIGLHGGGALFWAEGEEEAGRAQLRQRAARLQAWDYPVALLSQAEMQTLEPQALFGEGAEGLFAPADRWVDTPRLVRFCAERARERGAEIREYCPALGFTRSVVGTISTVETPQGRISTRLLVLAAGVQTPSLVAQVTGDPAGSSRIPVQRVPGLLVETPPGSAPGQAQRVLYPPEKGGLHLRPTPGGGLLLGADDTDAALNDPDASYPPEAPAGLLARAARFLPGLPVEPLQDALAARVCVRPVPGDGLPIVGPLPGVDGVFIAVTHSGVTLGPLLAHYLAEEMVSGRIWPLLTPYRPARFL